MYKNNIYIYIYTHVCIYVHMIIYIYIYGKDQWTSSDRDNFEDALMSHTDVDCTAFSTNASGVCALH